LINFSIFGGEISPKVLYHKIQKRKKKKQKKAPGVCWVEDGVGVYSLIVNPGSSSKCYVAGCPCKYLLTFPPRHSFIPAEGTFSWKSFYKLSVKMSTYKSEGL
jgi:hypothetical protein